MPPTDDEIAERLAAEMRLLRVPLEELTGLTSRWNGTVVVDRFLPALERAWALFRPDGVVVVRPALASLRIRWRTLLHELVHSIALPVGTHYDEYIGWEEGPVETLQRALLASVMSRAGLEHDAALVREYESFWEYNEYVRQIGELSGLLGYSDPQQFSIELLGVRLEARSKHLLLRATRTGRLDRLPQIARAAVQLQRRPVRDYTDAEKRRIQEIESEVDGDG